MRKLLSSVAAVLISGSLFAGGLVTNTNQSATWVRLPARNASTGIDAAYYNPAGLMKLPNGFHLSLSNQSIWQTREVDDNYPRLNNGVYKGTVNAPLFPSLYAAYKLDRFAFSLGFGPIGGGGGAEFKAGLPSFELSPSDLVPSLAAAPYSATGYKMDVYFKGTSTFLGYQGALSFKINDKISVAAGVRYVTAKNTYEGYLKNIQVNIASGWTRADAIMTGIASSASTAATSTSALVAGGAGSLTLAQASGPPYNLINASQRAQLEGGLTSFGSPTTVTIAQADAVFKGAAAKYTATATLLNDQSADVSQTGTGYTPFFSVNLTPVENLNIAVKYEMMTKIELTNKTNKDFMVGFSPTGTPLTMFPNGTKVRNDMPAMLTIGAEYKFPMGLRAALGMDYFFDKQANYGHTIMGTNGLVPLPNSLIFDENGISYSGGLEYAVTKKLLVSGGYSWANQGANSFYQSDLNYGLGTETFGFGAAYNVTDKIQVNLGASWTMYYSDYKVIDHIFNGAYTFPAERYKKDSKIIGIGVDMSF